MSADELPSRDALLGFVMRYLQYRANDDGANVKAQHIESFPIVWGVCQRVRRFARAYLRLVKHELATAGHPIVRAALEHAVTAQWVFYSADGPARFRKSMALDQLALATVVGGLKDDDPITATLKSYVPDAKGMPPWKQIRQDLDDPTDFVSHTYQVLSQAVHVTHGVVRDSFMYDDNGELHIREAPEDEYPHQVLYTLAASCMLAWWLEATSYGDQTRLQRLQEDGSRLALRWRLDGRLPPDQRRFSDD